MFIFICADPLNDFYKEILATLLRLKKKQNEFFDNDNKESVQAAITIQIGGNIDFSDINLQEEKIGDTNDIYENVHIIEEEPKTQLIFTTSRISIENDIDLLKQ